MESWLVKCFQNWWCRFISCYLNDLSGCSASSIVLDLTIAYTITPKIWKDVHVQVHLHVHTWNFVAERPVVNDEGYQVWRAVCSRLLAATNCQKFTLIEFAFLVSVCFLSIHSLNRRCNCKTMCPRSDCCLDA